MSDLTELRGLARRAFAAGVAAAEPGAALTRALAARALPEAERVLVISIGKAALAMAEAALAHLGDSVPVEALAVTNYENAHDVPGLRVIAAAHPVPDRNGLEAGRAVGAMVDAAGPGDLVLALVSGGASALVPAPVPGVSLADKSAVNALLLASGFEITEMNLVRQSLSTLKGGGLLRRAAPAAVRSFVLSDVLGDDLRVVASGPSVGPLGSPAEAEALLRTRGLWDALPDSAPRIMSTSQIDLAAEMEAGRFREDLFYRLGGVTLNVPSLRERVDDIPLLTDHFLARAERDGASLKQLAPNAMDMVRTYSWPGNVRQLENAVRRLVVTSAEDEITRGDVELVLGNQPAMEPLRGGGEGEKLSASVAAHLRRYFDLHGGVLPAPGLYQRILKEVEMPLIEIALDATGGNQAKCADLLGINRNTLRKKITDLDIRVTRRRKLM